MIPDINAAAGGFNMALFAFRKEERLKKKQQIDLLFKTGMSFFHYPFKVIWLYTESENPYPVEVLISASRRSMKRAVDRNRIKRLIREVYRHHKGEIYNYLADNDKHALVAIIYTGYELLTFEQVEEKINLVMARLIKEMRKQHEG